MNDQKIYELIAKHGRVRAVQLADWLDKELMDVSEALRCLVDVGDVVKFKALGPNGHEALHYELSEDFKRSCTGREILLRVEAAPGPSETPAPAPAPAAPAPASPATAPGEPATGTYVERALAYITKHSDTPDEVLRMALGLAKGHYPVSYLGAAIRAGKIRKDGGIWRMGTGVAPFNGPAVTAKGGQVAPFDPKAPLEYPAGTEKPPAPSSTPAPAPAPAPAARPMIPDGLDADPAKSPATLDVPVFLPKSEPAPEPSELPAPAPVYRAALWSDGILELQRNGATVYECTRGEHEFMAEFLGRALGEAGRAAA